MRWVGVSLQFFRWTCWTSSRSCGKAAWVVFIACLTWRDGGVSQFSNFLDLSVFSCGPSQSGRSCQIPKVPRTMRWGSRRGPMKRSWCSRFSTNCFCRCLVEYFEPGVHLFKTWTSKSIKFVCEYYWKDPSRVGTRGFCPLRPRRRS